MGYRADKHLRINSLGKYVTFTITDGELNELFAFNLHRTEAKIFANRLLEVVATIADSSNGINGVSLGAAPTPNQVAESQRAAAEGS